MTKKKLKLTLWLEIDPCGESTKDLIHGVNATVKLNLGLGSFLPDNSPATIEGYSYEVKELKS